MMMSPLVLLIHILSVGAELLPGLGLSELPGLSELSEMLPSRPSYETQLVCDTLFALYPQNLAYDTLGSSAIKSVLLAAPYTSATREYWNNANWQHRPACVFLPASAQQVSDAVRILCQYPSVQFALKGGGHNPASGFASVKDGVLIAFEANLATTERTADGRHFIVGAGSRWQDVYKVTGQTNEVVVGGRLGHVGVAGFSLGGGLSYLSAQYGLTCDNIDNFEAVLANGTIVNANRQDNPSLWWALRGGGNQFAIVTRMWMQAHPAGINGQVWGGLRTFAPEQRYEVFRAVTRFVRDYPDPKAAIIPIFLFGMPGNMLNALTGPFVFMFYDGPSPPPGALDDFLAIKPMIDTTKTRSYYDLTQELGGADFIGFSQAFRVATFPNLEENAMTAFLDGAWNTTFSETFASGLQNFFDLQLTTWEPQPLSRRIQEASLAQGGNALGLDPRQGDKIWMITTRMWMNPLSHPQHESKQFLDGLLSTHRNMYDGTGATNYEALGDDPSMHYSPMFMNDAAHDQGEDVYRSYGATNLASLQSIKWSYDPTGFFTNRQGGHKIPGTSGWVRT